MVGYHFAEEKKLIVTLSERTAKKMIADGWDVSYENEIGHFIVIQKE